METLDLYICEIVKIATPIYLHNYQIYTRRYQDKVLVYSNLKNDKNNKMNLDTSNKYI